MGVGGVCVGLVGPARAGFCGVCLWLEVFGSGSVLVVVHAGGGLGVSLWCSVVVVGLGVMFGWSFLVGGGCFVWWVWGLFLVFLVVGDLELVRPGSPMSIGLGYMLVFLRPWR